jgi:hypothetical protein
MKKFGALGLGSLMALSLLIAPPAQSETNSERGKAFLFNFDPSALFMVVPALAMGEGFGGTSIRSNTRASSYMRLQTNTDNDSEPSFNIANLTQQDFAKGFVTSLLEFAQANQANTNSLRRVTAVSGAPFFILAFFKTLGIEAEQMPLLKLFRLGSASMSTSRSSSFDVKKEGAGIFFFNNPNANFKNYSNPDVSDGQAD